MRIDILTVVPELLESPLSHSIVGRAIKKGLVEIHVHNLRKYGKGPRQQVDDYSYGGDAGMVLMLEPVYNMIQELKAEREYDEVIYMSPDGDILNQNISNELSLMENIIILCGHYKGIDHRIREHLVTREISCGDYVQTYLMTEKCVTIDWDYPYVIGNTNATGFYRRQDLGCGICAVFARIRIRTITECAFFSCGEQTG